MSGRCPYGHKPKGYLIPSDRLKSVPIYTLKGERTLCSAQLSDGLHTLQPVQTERKLRERRLPGRPGKPGVTKKQSRVHQSSASVISSPPSMVAAKLYRNDPSVASAVKITTSTQAMRAVTPITFWVLMYS